LRGSRKALGQLGPVGFRDQRGQRSSDQVVPWMADPPLEEGIGVVDAPRGSTPITASCTSVSSVRQRASLARICFA
jgi:hypothetical protein